MKKVKSWGIWQKKKKASKFEIAVGIGESKAGEEKKIETLEVNVISCLRFFFFFSFCKYVGTTLQQNGWKKIVYDILSIKNVKSWIFSFSSAQSELYVRTLYKIVRYFLFFDLRSLEMVKNGKKWEKKGNEMKSPFWRLFYKHCAIFRYRR